MQVPEKLSLIGGSILLASTLIFTLKSQASQILPKINDASSKIFDHIQDGRGNNDFDSNFKDAQKNGWKTGMWGSAKYYIDKDMNMYVGSGQLNGSLDKALDNKDLHSVRTINFKGTVVAPQNSYGLLSGKDMSKGADADGNSSIQAINGLENMDVSHVQNMAQLFYRDFSLHNDLNIDNWDVSHVTNMDGIFGRTGLTSISVPDWNVSKVQDLGHAFLDSNAIHSINLHDWHLNNGNIYMDHIFAGDSSLASLDVSNLDTSDSDMEMAFGGDNISSTDDHLNHLSLGDKFYFMSHSGLSGIWKNGDQTMQGDHFPYSDTNKSSHPGIWIRQ